MRWPVRVENIKQTGIVNANIGCWGFFSFGVFRGQAEKYITILLRGQQLHSFKESENKTR